MIIIDRATSALRSESFVCRMAAVAAHQPPTDKRSEALPKGHQTPRHAATSQRWVDRQTFVLARTQKTKGVKSRSWDPHQLNSFGPGARARPRPAAPAFHMPHLNMREAFSPRSTDDLVKQGLTFSSSRFSSRMKKARGKLGGCGVR